MINFKYTIFDRTLCSLIMDIEVAGNIVTYEIEKAFNKIRQYAKVDGFRQGKAPMRIIKQKFFNKAKNNAIDIIIKRTTLDSFDKEAFIPLDFPVIEELNYEIGQGLKYRLTAECHPKFNVKDYKDIPVTKEIFKVTNDNLSKRLGILRDENAKLVSSKLCEVTENSFVSVDYSAFDINGNVIPGMNVKGDIIDLSSKSTIGSFKEVLIGMKINDEKNIKIEYPTSFPNKTLIGKTINFKIKIIEIKEKVFPELNDNFAIDMRTRNLQDLKTKVKKEMEAHEEHRQNMNIAEQIVGHLLKKNKFEVPKSLILLQKKSLVKKMKNYLRNQGAPEEYIEKRVNLSDAKFAEDAEKNIRLSYILNAICLIENILVSNADIEIEKNKMKTLNHRKDKLTDEYFIDEKRNILFSLKEQKLFEFLYKNAKIKIEEKDMPLEKE